MYVHVHGHMQVTALCWNPRYPDLFAAGYGTYVFENQVLEEACLLLFYVGWCLHESNSYMDVLLLLYMCVVGGGCVSPMLT